MENKDFCPIKEMYCEKHGSMCASYDICYHESAQNKIEIMKSIAEVETIEDLIRYIVCDGEPADESCVGHPVLFSGITPLSRQKFNWKEGVLIGIQENPIGYHEEKPPGDLIAWPFAKKIPGYDYSEKK